MAEEALDSILIQITVPLPVPMIYAAWTTPDQLQGWLCERARVGDAVGGDYDLVFRDPVAFESAGTILQRTDGVDLGFSWLAPPAFERIANRPKPRTQVYVRLQESPEGVDITLEHAGWESGEAWEEARSWHFHFWEDRLFRLKDYLIKTAYG